MTRRKRQPATSGPSERAQLRLRRNLDRKVRSGHPWIYADALEGSPPPPGQEVDLLGKDGRWLGRGLSEAGPIAVRLFTTTDRPIDGALFGERIDQALSLREAVIPEDTNAYRLLHGEGDALPGFVCDRYDRVAVLRLDGEAAPTQLDKVAVALQARLPALGVESLVLRSGRGEDKQLRCLWGPEPEAEIVVRERGMKLLAPIRHGQKTGLFLDHREARARVRALAAGRETLNLYGYTGAFSVAAALGGARRVTTVDIAPAAIEMVHRNLALNGFDAAAHPTLTEDVLEHLDRRVPERDAPDLVICDPPNFAPSERSVERALESYRKLHARCLTTVSQGGLYLAASCSSHVPMADFEASLAQGAAQARCKVQVLERGGAPGDHPRWLAFPEGDYLKAILCRVWHDAPRRAGR